MSRAAPVSQGFTLAEVIIAAGLLASVWISLVALQLEALRSSEAALDQIALIDADADRVLLRQTPLRPSDSQQGRWRIDYSDDENLPLERLELWQR
ncbi:MAG: hypothetical protein ISN29_11990 [Gammaproteobacteria bacterium AqS3]|nr:hypothetical protein [Gammaproteobacteria bacterium AqS3]